jgi:DNA invertase Pin-like site-specific DNA recombinase
MMMQIFGMFSEFETAMLRERMKTGLDSARREGRIDGHTGFQVSCVHSILDFALIVT